MNYSLRTLLIVAAGVSVLCASLVYPRPIVGDLFYTLGLVLIAYGLIAAIYYRGPRRAFWIGFVLLFASYFAHTVWPNAIHSAWMVFYQQEVGGQFVPSQLISSRLLPYAYMLLNPSSSVGSAIINGPGGYASRTVLGAGEVPGQFIAFMTVAQTSIGVLVGIGGGLVARRIAGRRMAIVDQLVEAERKINH